MSDPQRDDSPRKASRDDAVAVVRRLRESGHVAYFAGGCVRDQLLGLEPKDYDVATDAPPDRVRQLFSNTQAVGAAFGVILVRHRKSQIEVATFRTDLQYRDGRRPEGVVFTTAEEDAKRRDFTINGMFYDPVEEKVIDYVGGRADLQGRLLRAIGNPRERFGEDYLRLLRAVRFAARFDLEIEPATADAMLKSAGWLSAITPERIAEELRLMLAPPTRTRAWPMLWRFKLTDVIFRYLVQGPVTFKPQSSLLLALIAANEPITFGLALAAATLETWLMEDAGRDVRARLEPRAVRTMVQAMRKALRISNDESDEMGDALAGIAPLLADAPPPTLAQKKRFLARPSAASSRQLLRALGRIGLFQDRVEALEAEFDELAKSEFAPPPLVTGDDLTAAGLQPGPVFKRVLDAVYDAQLEDRVRTKAEAMELAMKLASSEPPPKL